MRKLCFLSVLLLSACTSMGPHVDYLYDGPNGAVYEAYCDGTANTIGKCYQLAADMCNGNFKILDKGQQSNKARLYNPMGTNGVAVDKYTITKRYMIFHCQK